MDMTEYISPELLILIPVLYLVGCAIKKSDCKDKFIPFILGGLGIVLALLYTFATIEIYGLQSYILAVFTAITQGILCAGASVYANQLFKQFKE